MVETIDYILKCLFLILLSARTISAAPGILEKRESLLVPFEGICTAYIKEAHAAVRRQELGCQTSNGISYNIPIADKEWIRAKTSTGDLISGETVLDIPPETLVDMATYTLQLSSPPGLLNIMDDEHRDQQRQLRKLASTGTKTVLAVRIAATDKTSTLTETELSDDIFGLNGDPMNAKSQFLACSYNQFELTPASDRTGATASIKNGATTISVDLATSSDAITIMNEATLQLAAEFSTDAQNLADFIMFCIPDGSMGEKEVAFAYVNGFQSWYNDEACGFVSAQMHEIGHSLVSGSLSNPLLTAI